MRGGEKHTHAQREREKERERFKSTVKEKVCVYYKDQVANVSRKKWVLVMRNERNKYSV